MEEQESEVIVNDQSSNGQSQAPKANNGGNIFTSHISMWLSFIALAVFFIYRLLVVCEVSFTARGIIFWIALGVAFAALIVEGIKFAITRKFSAKGDLFFVSAIIVIMWFF